MNDDLANQKTAIHQIRIRFQPSFGDEVGADLLKEAQNLRNAAPDHAASAVLARWRGDEKTTALRVVTHPPGVPAPVALVAGRHSRCDLGSIPGASLRHALILLWPPKDNDTPPLAEVLDLGTRVGLGLPDGRLAAHLAGTAALRFGVASADLVTLQARPGEPFPDAPALKRCWQTGVEPEELTLHSEHPHTRHLDIGADKPSVNGLQASPVPEGSCLSVVVGANEAIATEQAMLTQVIRLDEIHVRPQVQVRAQDLQRGVRLGRYRRCRGSSVLSHDDRVSRVHALVLERSGQRWLFDTASTNGTQVYDLDAGVTFGPIRGKRTFALMTGQAPLLAGKVALLNVGQPQAPS